MARPTDRRQITFRGTPGGALERSVQRPGGRPYAHRCSQQVFEALAAYLDEHQDQSLSLASLADAVGAPMTQVHVALQLLAERGLLEGEGRSGRVAAGYRGGFYEHAMTEFYALIEGCPPQQHEG